MGCFAMKSTKGIFICRSITPLKTKETIQGKKRGSAELLHFGKSRTNCIAGGMGKGAGSQGTEKA